MQILDKCLSEYPTTLAQDAALLASLSSRGTASSSTAGSGGSTGAAAGGSARKARKTEKGKAAGQVEDKEREATGSGAGGSAGGGDEASLSQQRKRLAMMVSLTAGAAGCTYSWWGTCIQASTPVCTGTWMRSCLSGSGAVAIEVCWASLACQMLYQQGEQMDVSCCTCAVWQVRMGEKEVLQMAKKQVGRWVG
jgi:hypothetical protein